MNRDYISILDPSSLNPFQRIDRMTLYRKLRKNVPHDYSLEKALADYEARTPKPAKIPALNMLFVSRDLDYTGNTYPPNQEWVNPNPGQQNVGYSDVWNMSDEEVIKYLTEVEMFGRVRKLEDGSFVGCMKLAYTMSVCTDITPTTPYAYRWCFKDPEEAFYFCDNIKEFDEIPEHRTSLQGHRFARESRLAATDRLGFKRW